MIFLSFVVSVFGFFDLFHRIDNLHVLLRTNWIETVCAATEMWQRIETTNYAKWNIANDAIEAEFTEFGASCLPWCGCIEIRIQKCFVQVTSTISSVCSDLDESPCLPLVKKANLYSILQHQEQKKASQMQSHIFALITISHLVVTRFVCARNLVYIIQFNAIPLPIFKHFVCHCTVSAAKTIRRPNYLFGSKHITESNEENNDKPTNNHNELIQ